MGSTAPLKVAIITGATSGIGASLAAHLYKNEWTIALVGRRADAGHDLAQSLGPRAQFFQADVASYASQAAMFLAVWKTWGRIDALCANAGIVDKASVYLLGHRPESVEQLPPEPDLECTDICYKGVVYGTMLATHFMRFNEGVRDGVKGKIVITGSIGGVFPHRSYPEYCGTKAAICQWVRGVAPVLELKHNVSINVVLPGIVATPIVTEEMIEAVSAECVTPVETVLAGYDRFLDDETGTTGQLLEASAEKLILYDPPKEGNGSVTKRAVTVWEPLFKMAHGEISGLPDAIPE